MVFVVLAGFKHNILPSLVKKNYAAMAVNTLLSNILI